MGVSGWGSESSVSLDKGKKGLQVYEYQTLTSFLCYIYYICNKRKSGKDLWRHGIRISTPPAEDTDVNNQLIAFQKQCNLLPGDHTWVQIIKKCNLLPGNHTWVQIIKSRGRTSCDPPPSSPLQIFEFNGPGSNPHSASCWPVSTFHQSWIVPSFFAYS